MAYARRWQVEMCYRSCKTDLAMESPRLWFWENRLKLLLMVSLAYALLLSLLAAALTLFGPGHPQALVPLNGRAVPPSCDTALQIARRPERPMADPSPSIHHRLPNSGTTRPKPESTERLKLGLLSGRLVGWEGQRWNHWPGEWGSGVPEWPWVIQTVGRQSAENPRRPGWCELVGTFNWLMSKLVASGGVKPGVEWPATAPGRRGTGFPKASAWGEMQYEAPGLAGDSSGQGKEASPQGLGGCYRLSQGDAPGPAGQIVGHDLYRQPGSIG